MSKLTIEEREMEFNKLCIHSTKGIAKHILYVAEYIANKKNFKEKRIDSSFNNKKIAYCPQLCDGIISFNSFIDTETMKVISSNVEVNEYKFTGTKSDELVNALKQLGLQHFFGFLRQLLLKDKLASKNLDKEMILCLTVKKEQLDYMNFKKIKDSLLSLKEIMG